MKLTRLARLLLISICIMMIATAAWADVRLPKVIGSRMVLQREMAVPIWGWADPGEKVTVTLGDCKVEATACEKGKWALKLAAMKAGGPHSITVAGKNTVTLEDVLVGEVWVCSGQSRQDEYTPNGRVSGARRCLTPGRFGGRIPINSI